MGFDFLLFLGHMCFQPGQNVAKTSSRFNSFMISCRAFGVESHGHILRTGLPEETGDFGNALSVLSHRVPAAEMKSTGVLESIFFRLLLRAIYCKPSIISRNMPAVGRKSQSGSAI